MNHTRSPIGWLATLLVVCLPMAGSGADAPSITIPRQQHAWARFEPGAWSKVRKWLEELDESGNVKSASVTETKTTLVSVDDTGYTVQMDVTVEVAGKRFVAQPRQVRIGYDGATDGGQATYRKTGETNLDVGGKSVRCAILENVRKDDESRIVTTLNYSDSVSPFVLRRETIVTNADGSQVAERTNVEALAIEMPQRISAEVQPGTYMRTVRKLSNASTLTIEVVCLDVPGGVVAHSSKDTDASGKVVRRSTLELVDYGIGAAAEPPRRVYFLPHGRSRRTQNVGRP